MGALAGTEAVALLNAVNLATAYTAPSSPLKVRLCTTTPTATTAGTEVTGGSYVAQTVTFTAASGTTSSTSNPGALSYTLMPAVTVTAVEVWDSAGSPRRLWWGLLTASKVVNSGDTFQIAIGALVTSFT